MWRGSCFGAVVFLVTDNHTSVFHTSVAASWRHCAVFFGKPLVFLSPCVCVRNPNGFFGRAAHNICLCDLGGRVPLVGSMKKALVGSDANVRANTTDSWRIDSRISGGVGYCEGRFGRTRSPSSTESGQHTSTRAGGSSCGEGAVASGFWWVVVVVVRSIMQ